MNENDRVGLGKNVELLFDAVDTNTCVRWTLRFGEAVVARGELRAVVVAYQSGRKNTEMLLDVQFTDLIGRRQVSLAGTMLTDVYRALVKRISKP